MTTKTKALKLAQEGVEIHAPNSPEYIVCAALIEALAQPDYEKAYLVWQDKTEWVQETVKPHELGMHRADVLKQRIEELAQPKEPEQEPNGLAAYVIGCFGAAEAEGLQEVLSETTDERLKDLVERRLMYALYEAQKPQPKEPEQQPVAYDGKATEGGARYQADQHLRALLRYTENFYGVAIKHGMRAGVTANAIAHIEKSGKALHELVHAWVGVAETRTTPPQRKPQFKEFIKWAGAQGYDCAQTCNSDTGEWICLNPMTADLWKAWQAAHGVKS